MSKNNWMALTAVVCFVGTGIAQQRQYFDEDWNPTTKDKMSYYRESSKQGNFTLLKDYYKSGVLQMEGLASDTTPGSEVFEGKVTWYYVDGKVYRVQEYKGGEISGVVKSFDEKGRPVQDFVLKSDDYNGKSYVYADIEEGNYYNSVTEYKNSAVVYSLTYEKSPTGIRYEITNRDGKGDVVKYYDGNGKLIGTRTTSADYNYSGTEVEYYYNPMAVSRISKYAKDGTVTESTSFYRNGKTMQVKKADKKSSSEITYDQNGVKIGELKSKYNKDCDDVQAFEGKRIEFFPDSEIINSEAQFANFNMTSRKIYDEEGNITESSLMSDGEVAETTFYKEDGSVKGKITYKDGDPYDGTVYETGSETIYKSGVLQSQRLTDGDGNLRLEKKLNAKNLYDAKVYNENNELAYSYLCNVGEDTFSAKVVQYGAKGKVINKATIVGDYLTEGKIRMMAYDGGIEIERIGKWAYKRIFNHDGKLIQETKKLIESNDDLGDESYVTENSLLGTY